ncbi:hypothetical protein ACFW6F_31245 [Streptomyces sp. NPDC058746]|uniref:hypothetical protein n=1 Tax=Streptomyces sp. NPDC058746 TaxID=3346622 RepID=UPI00367E65AD
MAAGPGRGRPCLSLIEELAPGVVGGTDAEIDVNPERTWFDEDDLTALADRLGHPVKQIRAHL